MRATKDQLAHRRRLHAQAIAAASERPADLPMVRIEQFGPSLGKPRKLQACPQTPEKR